jgi:RNA polymerase sigma-70 factor, ECF subfamily
MASTDEELVARSIGGDMDSFNQLVIRWERPIYALAYRVIGREEDARDVCQETFLRAFRSINGFRGQAKFSSWLYRIALNLCRDWIRRERRTPTVQAPEGVDVIELAAEQGPAESIEDLVARRDVGRHVAVAMQALSEDQRDRHHPEGISGADVPGDCRLAGMSAEHGQDQVVSRPHGAAP